MKNIHYHPLTQPATLTPPPEPLPLEALSSVIFQHTSLEEALLELMREGYAGARGEKIIKGIKDLLETIKNIKERGYASLESPLSTDDADSARRSPLEGGDHLIDEKMVSDTPPLPLQEALSLPADQFHKLEQLEKTLKRVYRGYDLESVDEKLLEELLGIALLHDWQLIKNLNAHMRAQGLARRGPSGLTLTSRGLQKIALEMLKEIFKTLRHDPLSRRLNSELSTEPYLTEGLRPYHFGDPPLIEPTQSLLNAITRTGPRVPIQLEEKDFVIYQKEILSKSATVVLLDLSRSMRFENRYIAAKKVTLALYGLVRTRYPKDRIAVVGFSTKAHPIKDTEIPFLTWDETNPYTNMEEALDIAHKILSLHKGYRRQVFLITDGEPTAHRERGYLFFQFPPHPKTLVKTLRKLENLSRHQIAISIFLLSKEKDRVSYVHEMAKRCGGKIFHLEPDELGRCLCMDYVEKKQKWI